ncbi:hypothetical protein PVAND_006667 [Polypedilum vanderplanki]|uniref:Calponin-homology (CH) domain-containing protein n=1 Tax=Polypedilum vanderplanki TaxID=319348 RepID=A0A9J6C3W7_POLVA|nr:hypothetical protein PVAND_006667 [Polypedilum vanderplanki]
MNLTRSLEKILDECTISGELLLANRKLKDFPKYYGNLTDTVFADLSRNRFSELPEDITTFAFLERLLLYHNGIRSIPESVRGLNSLTYLDLRSNQLTVLPREICYLPLQIFLISNNRLLSLPDELGRMNTLTELDAGCNQLTHLPARLSELSSLKSLCLRNNQLMYLPRDLTNLNLFSLDISCNKIASLPVELRLMTTLVDLNLADNPLTSPPAHICVRGMIHVFKHLEIIAAREGKVEGTNSLRRSLPKQHSNPILNDSQKCKRNTVDSGYSVSDYGLDSKWQETGNTPKWTLPSQSLHVRTELSKSDTSTPAGIHSPSGLYEHSLDDDLLKKELEKRNLTHSNPTLSNGFSIVNNDTSPEANTPDSQKSDEKVKYGSVQTYREYKEALRLQRSQDSLSIYKTKDVSTPDGSNEPIFKSQSSSPYNSSSQTSPISPYRNVNLSVMNSNGLQYSEENKSGRPVQKVTPSRSTSYQNGNHVNGKEITDSYTKPNSPFKVSDNCKQNNNANGSIKGALVNNNKQSGTTVGFINNKCGQKPNKSVSWTRDVSTEKLSFTMRREFDKHKEEEELIKQLRNILETKLKMSLPEDLAPALADGVVLCHLANYIKPQSVSSIHVPSPAVPKLTMARCRRNVDNFLEACRKIGIDEESICSCSDIVPSNEDQQRPPNELAMYCTINTLLLHHEKLKQAMRTGIDATNTKSTNDDLGEFVDDSVSLLRGIRRIPDTLDFNRKRKLANVKFHLPEVSNSKNEDDFDEVTLTEIIEECEYDSDIGKFKCKDDELIEHDESDNSSTSSMVDHYLEVKHLNNLNSPPNYNTEDDSKIKNNIDNRNSYYHNVLKQIEFFESSNILKNCEDTVQQLANDQNLKKSYVPTHEDKNLMCCASDILEGKAIVQVAITVSELSKYQTPPNIIKSPQRYQNNIYSNNMNEINNDGFISKSSSSSSSQLSSNSPSSPIV